MSDDDTLCGRCGGAVVPSWRWESMPEPLLQAWVAKLAADEAREQRRRPGDRWLPALCRCRGGTGPHEALQALRGER